MPKASIVPLGFALAGALVVARHRVRPPEPRRGRSGASIVNQSRRVEQRWLHGGGAVATNNGGATSGGRGGMRRSKNPKHVGVDAC
jgi:hypothetical protein